MMERKKCVAIQDEISSVETVLTGLSEGSVQGLLLFLIFINDLNTCIKSSKTYHITDDTSVM